jgi:ribosomal protein S18 acetylase RimI-like enzyme
MKPEIWGHDSAHEFGARLSESAFADAAFLPWDSGLFGLRAGRISRLQGSAQELRYLLPPLLLEFSRRSITHITARVPAADLSAAHLLGHFGFELIDIIQTFSRQLPAEFPAPTPPPGIQLRLHRPEDTEQICAIARRAYRFDRFHADRALTTEQADRVNEEWLRNSCRGEGADAIAVATRGHEVLSYVTCRCHQPTQSGNIIMVATHPDAQGQGLAKATTAFALAWFANQGMRKVEVGTQLRNIPASRTYEQSGFRLTSASLTWRFYNGAVAHPSAA